MGERAVQHTAPAVRTVEGEGFEVRRAFPTPRAEAPDPFLLLDHHGPEDLAPGEAKGAPDHPHRGFETVTYVLDGEAEHKDSAGNQGLLASGDVQWMTAGAGVVHSEMPSARIRRDGGRLQFLQLWVNLPAADKMVAPRYQDVGASAIPEIEPAPGVRARVVAGRVFDTDGPVETHSPFQYLRLTLEPNARVEVPVPDAQEVFAYVMEAGAEIGGRPHHAEAGTLVRFSPPREGSTGTNDVVVSTTDERGADLIVVGGRPLREPVARYGPFVMNTRDEIVQAVEDFRAGRMGRITG